MHWKAKCHMFEKGQKLNGLKEWSQHFTSGKSFFLANFREVLVPL